MFVSLPRMYTTHNPFCLLPTGAQSHQQSYFIYHLFCPFVLRHFNAHALNTFTLGGKCDLLCRLIEKAWQKFFQTYSLSHPL